MYLLQSETNNIGAIAITVPQRKSNPKDKNRVKWADAKHLALVATGCKDTAEVRSYLKMLGVGGKLNLRLTTAWIAVRKDLAEAIKNEKANLVDIYKYKKPEAFIAELIIEKVEPVKSSNYQLLEKALEQGKIKSFKEDEEGDMFWVYLQNELNPKLISGLAVTKFYRSIGCA